MTALRAIHAGVRQLGLDDDLKRALYRQVTGKSSAADMSEAERAAVVAELRRRGFKQVSKGKRKQLEGKYAPKLQALWIAGWNLGVVRDRDDAAMIAFIKRQAKVDHTRFLHHHTDATSVIEGLKGWLARDGGVDWTDKGKPDGRRIAEAQWRKLGQQADGSPFRDQVLDLTGAAFVCDIDRAGWIVVMNSLGARIRAARATTAG